MTMVRGSFVAQAIYNTRNGYPRDLREEGNPHDEAFNRPIVYGRIDTGVVEYRRPGSDVVERVEPKKRIKEVPAVEARTNNATEAAQGTNRLETVAKMYNEGATYEQIAQAIGLKRGSISRYVNRAMNEGLIDRGRNARRGGVERMEEVLARIGSIEARLKEVEMSKASVGLKRLSVSEGIEETLGEIRQELATLANGLAEITERVNALEGREEPKDADPDMTMTRQFMRLLELVLAGERKSA